MEETLSHNLAKLSVNNTTASQQLQQSTEQVEATPEQVRALTNPTEQFLCKSSDNWPHLKFGGFKIRDMRSKITLIEVKDEDVENEGVKDSDSPSTRVIKYHLGPDFLKLRTIGLTLNFSNGD